MKKIISLLFFVPFVASAAGLIDFIDSAFYLVNNMLIPIAFALCILYFFWGVAKYIKTGAGSEKDIGEGKRIMTWGIVGLFVAFSIWGIVNLMKNELGIPNIENPKAFPDRQAN
jgi:FtsH-binding integral membrane protein